MNKKRIALTCVFFVWSLLSCIEIPTLEKATESSRQAWAENNAPAQGDSGQNQSLKRSEVLKQAQELLGRTGQDRSKAVDQQVQEEEEQTGSQEFSLDVREAAGTKLNINVLDTSIRKILSSLALTLDINIAMASDVSGNISLHLNNVGLKEALRAITMAGGYTYSVHGRDLYYVYKPKGEYQPESERQEVRIFNLQYASLEKVEEILDSMTESGLIKVHEDTQTILVQDTPEKIEQIESVIKQWDTMPKQVLIEAKILEIRLTRAMDFGVNWEQVLGDVRIGTGGFSTGILPDSEGVSPVPSEGSGLFGNIITAAGTRHQFAAALDLLQSKTEVHSLSSPKILAIHGKPARVQVGGKQGYKVTTISDGLASEDIRFIDTGTILEITPYISDKKILLQARPSINSAEISEGIPTVTSTNVSTWLLADDGQTVFIGGLIQNSRTRDRNTVPCLGSIPGLNPLFGNTRNTRDKVERVILITPYIIVPGDQKLEQTGIEKTKELEERFENEPRLQEEKLLEQFLHPNRPWGEEE
ncbi:MAG: hypothetical protein K9K79_05650 [Desulfohalobiaceae bacterium]|nr:hypothetical protein [Desulfohalobiaceae bacterium]